MAGFKNLFEFRAATSDRTKLVLEIGGSIFFLALWTLLVETGVIPSRVVPSPIAIVKSLGELHFEDALVRNAGYSIAINFTGLLEAVLFALPIGFVLGLFPFFRDMCARLVASSRFLPITGLLGLFINWFGIETNMKIQFLAFSIFVYLLPAVVARIASVEEVYEQTAYTLGASKWQVFKTVYWPAVTSRVYDDIVNLAALSWTYVVIVEVLNSEDGGIGALIFKAQKNTRYDKVFALLFTIMIIGFIWDKILNYFGKMFFPYRFLNAGR